MYITKDQALEETVLTLFHPVVHVWFQLVGVAVEDSIACYDVVKGYLSKVGLAGLVDTK